MDHLSKQQLVLLALLVSFVTSLATGIFTVSLMNQAPREIVRTINQVVEKTVQTVAPQQASVGDVGKVNINVEDQVANAVAKVAPSVVKIITRGSDNVSGLGLVVSDNGVIVTDKSVIAPINSYSALFSDGKSIPISVIQSQVDGDIVFLAPDFDNNITSTPIDFINSDIRLGQSIWSLSGDKDSFLEQGIVSKVANNTKDSSSDTISVIATSISKEHITFGSPLFDATGAVLGIYTTSLSKDSSKASFYPITEIKSAVPKR